MNNSRYARVLMPSIPRQAFAPNRWKLVPIAIHIALIVAVWMVLPSVSSTYWPLLSVFLGLNLASIPILAHEVSHRMVIRNRFLLYPTELIMWSLISMPPTVWRRVHVRHHISTNTPDDPKRRFFKSEISISTRVFSKIFFPRQGHKYNVLWAFFLAGNNVRNLVAAFYPGHSKPMLAAGKPAYSTGDKVMIVLELAFIVALQFVILSHSLKPLTNDGDALQGSTSVTLPKIIDTLHFNNSYHSEHHLFPHMNPAYYPLVRRLLEQHFPAEYHRVPLREAWPQLWKVPLYSSPPSPDQRVATLSNGERNDLSGATAAQHSH